MSEENKYIEQKIKMDLLKKELTSVFKKYGLGIKEIDDYNGMDEFTGITQYFIINGEVWYGDTVSEIIKELIDSIK